MVNRKCFSRCRFYRPTFEILLFDSYIRRVGITWAKIKYRETVAWWLDALEVVFLLNYGALADQVAPAPDAAWWSHGAERRRGRVLETKGVGPLELVLASEVWFFVLMNSGSLTILLMQKWSRLMRVLRSRSSDDGDGPVVAMSGSKILKKGSWTQDGKNT